MDSGMKDVLAMGDETAQLTHSLAHGEEAKFAEEAVKEAASKPAMGEFVFPVIVDVFAQIMQGNFLPMFKFLKRAKADPSIDPFVYNSQGFNLLHLVISSSNYEFTKVVLDNFPEFINRRTKQGQTNLMIALNQKNFDIIKLILSKETVSLDASDSVGFDIFTYMIRNNSIVLFFYFLRRYLDHIYEHKEKADRDQQSFKSEENMQSQEELPSEQQIALNGLTRQKSSLLFKQSIFSFKNRDAQGCHLAHWAAFRDAEFLLKFLFRMGCDFSKKDNLGHITIEKATENNAVRVVHFLNSYTRYPFQTSYFLTGTWAPVEFDFLPASYSKIEGEYESEILKDSFILKKLGKSRFSYANLRYLYSKYNLKYKFGLLLYLLWIMVTVLCFTQQMSFSNNILKTLFFFTAVCCALLNAWFYT